MTVMSKGVCYVRQVAHKNGHYSLSILCTIFVKHAQLRFLNSKDSIHSNKGTRDEIKLAKGVVDKWTETEAQEKSRLQPRKERESLLRWCGGRYAFLLRQRHGSISTRT